MATITGFTADRMTQIENETIIDGAIIGGELILYTKEGTEINLGNVVESPSYNVSDVLVVGKTDSFGDLAGLPKTSTGERLETVGINNFDFEPGMGPFFSEILPDGTIAMPQIQLPVNQVYNTGKNMSMAFWSQQENAFYKVIVPTTEGALETLAVNAISGVVDDAGGADISDCTFVEINGQVVLFGLSALAYRGWDTSIYGIYPVLPAFVKSAVTGRWEYSEALSIFPADLQSSDPVHGTDVWPTTTNYFGQSVVNSKLPAELTSLPNSNHIAISIYGPRTGVNSGAVVVINPETKEQVAHHEFPDYSSASGATFRLFPRDINADPTSAVDDERILLNFDTFTQPNEMFNVIVHADSGTFTVSWAGVPSAALTLGASAAEVKAALEGIAGIGAGNVDVTLFRPFLVNTYSIYQVEMIGAKAAQNFSTTPVAIDTTSLVNNNASSINRWQTGGTAYSKAAPFPFVELSYDATNGTITQLTNLMVPHDAIVPDGRPEALDARFSFSCIDSEGTAWFVVRGTSSNPQAFTAFSFSGLHAWKKTAGERRYITENPLTGGSETEFGEDQPVPDLMSYGLHHDNNAPILSVSEDVASGGIVAASSSGKLKLIEPISGLTNRTANLLAVDDASDWSIVAGGSHSFAWDAGESAYAITAGSDSNMEARSATGLSGIEIPSAYQGELIQAELDVKADTVRGFVAPVIRFYDDAGTIIDALSGYGSTYITTNTVGYKTVVSSAIVPTGTKYVSLGIVVKDPLTGEAQFISRAVLYMAACTAVDDVEFNISDLYSDATGGVWLAKGFVDHQVRRLWLPFLQQMNEATATNTAYPGWLIGIDLNFKLRDRRPIAAREPILHNTTHLPGGSDEILPADIGAAEINSPHFTGVVTLDTTGASGSPDIVGEALPTAGIRWDATYGLMFVTGDTDRWRVGPSGNLIPNVANTYDIGASTNRVKDVYTQGKIYLTSLTVSQGSGSPESSLTAPVGSFYLDATNGVVWVKASGTGNTGWRALSFRVFSRQTADYTLAIEDRGRVVEMNLGVANNLTVPPNGTVAFPIGSIVDVAQYGAGLTTVVAGAGVTIRSRGGLLNSAGQYARFTLEKVGTNEWYLSGDLA